jgi:hypothetical protein
MTEEQRKTREDSIESSKGPGKFESEPIYVPYFWDMVLDGSGGESFYFGENESVYEMIEVSEEDREIFPELNGIFGLCLWESSQGFVNSASFDSEKEFNAEMANLQEQAEEEAELSQDCL